MPKILQLRRATTSALASITGAEGELIVDTTKDTVTVHDGVLAGGYPLAKTASPTFTGTLALAGSSSGAVTLQAGATPAAQTYTLPAAYPGATGYALTSTTAGVLSWAAASGGGGTTTNALTAGTGLALNSGTTFDGSAAKTVSLATSGASSGTYGNSYSSGSFIYMPQFTVDAYGRITSVTTNYVGVGGGTSLPSQMGNSGKYLTTDGTSLSWATVATSGGGITWSSNTSYGGSITVTNPTGYNVSGSTMVIVVVGSMVSGMSSSSLMSASGAFSEASGAGSNTKVFYTYTTSSLGLTTTISGLSGYAMAYTYLISGSGGISLSSAYSSSTSAAVASPSPYSGTPRIIAVSTASMLNLSTSAGAAAGGPTWANGSGFVHPNDSTLSAAVWVGTGSWSGSTASVLLTSNPSMMSWYLTGITGA